eukprot:602493_1
MEELIEFTLMLNQLDDNELIEFLSQSLKNHGASLFGKLFFNYFMHHCHRTEIKSHTQCLMDIINAREEKPSRITSHDRIDHLPSTLISECASYLPLNQYVLFSQTNRQIFVSTHKPFQLYHLPSSAFRDCPQTTSMHKFKSVKSICIDMGDFNQEISTQSANQSLWRYSSFDKVELSNKGNDQKQIKLFFNRNIINGNKICLFGFGNPAAGISGRLFWTTLLNRFQYTRHLSLKEIYLNPVTYPDVPCMCNIIATQLSNLISFSMYTGNDVMQEAGAMIVKAIGHQLESLTFPSDGVSQL